MTTVTDLAEQKKLIFRRGDYNIIDCGVRTGKTYWAVNNLKNFTRDGNLNRVLFLVDTTALKDNIIEEYADSCIEADDLWAAGPCAWSTDNVNKIGVMCYQRLGHLIMKKDTGFLNEVDVICWDECDSIFDFATQAFVNARKTDFARPGVTNAEVLTVIQEFSSKKEYMPLILLGEWERIIEAGRILCIGLSASPERAYYYYRGLVSASYQGKLEMNYRMASDLFFCNVLEHVRQLQPEPNKGYWCFSPLIETNRRIVEAANARGFHAIELHSMNNTDKPMNSEQQRVYDVVVTTGMVPLEYDFVVVNRALARGINIIDKRFTHVIIDSVNAVDRIQAARQTFKYQRHLKALAPSIPEEYLKRWLTVMECRDLAEYMNVPELDENNRSKIMTWNRLKEYLPIIGYQIEEKKKRIDGKLKQCYYITGEWHDVVLQDNNFLQLVEAKEELGQA